MKHTNAPKAVAVHCEGGIGRTGTVLAAYLVLEGDNWQSAITKVRAVEAAAIETPGQVESLKKLDEQKNR